MPLRRLRRQYKQLTEFERGRVISVTRRWIFFSRNWKKDVAGMYPLCMTDGGNSHRKVLFQEDRDPATRGPLLRGKTAVFTVRLWSTVLHMHLKFELM
ncbi:hypothetical protein AVEN_163214-1 [Araneus ventricosus]|uniref:Uncharacterized protein n=1 Tax=Araneus ventricosus TaxID=182803 RepID=A0A4Y2TFE0_ARAVE|nr:hypothetical protein AVEN_163214-1 [Araneus ventricosus]